MKIALLQYHAEGNKQKNVIKALKLSAKAAAKGAQFILLPESFNMQAGSNNAKSVCAAAEIIPGPSTVPFLEFAKEKKVFILLGSLYEKRKGQQKPYNTSVLIGPKGEIALTYQKIHLFHARIDGKEMKEANSFSRGKNLSIAKVKEFQLGLSICYDLRFPEMYAEYRKKGVSLFCAPSCFTHKTGEAHWEALLRARAIENLCYIAAPNQVGRGKNGVSLYGGSMVVDPWGKVIACASTKKEEIIYAELNLARMKKARRALPDF
ncbi:MAG: nitrilase-related carbon-nitrogen hydrolase [Candidatus Aceula meridiana]|nr:nitrilase-related carbon-nitrogen hydrolase [Candidatus Aceula meridiana]